MRCLRFFFRGLLWRRPAPYQRDGRCYSKGQLTSFIAVAALVVLAFMTSIFSLGFTIGVAAIGLIR